MLGFPEFPSLEELPACSFAPSPGGLPVLCCAGFSQCPRCFLFPFVPLFVRSRGAVRQWPNFPQRGAVSLGFGFKYQLVEIMGPVLHHLGSLLQKLGVGISPNDFFSLNMVQLQFDIARVMPKLSKEGCRTMSKAVRRCAVQTLRAEAEVN